MYGHLSPWSELYSECKGWLDVERSNGHFVDRDDILLEFFFRLERKATALQTLCEEREATVEVLALEDAQRREDDVKLLATWRTALSRMSEPESRKWRRVELMRMLGARLLKPQRPALHPPPFPYALPVVTLICTTTAVRLLL